MRNGIRKILLLETGDGLYKGTMDQIVAIDLEDPNDSNLYLLGNISKIKWHNGMTVKTSKYVKDGYMNSYVLFFKGHVDYNNDPSIYKNNPQPTYSLYGFKNGDPQAMIDGELNTPTHLFIDKLGDMPAMIISKDKSVLSSYAGISISAPAIPPAKDYDKKIFYSLVPKK
ncbi:hypothetical protein [Paenibacillus sp. Soil750]|uniref:hypothetical protein n=1 Tax=Paenibacillus sp. Soil750 TaxID=1736398 RepID=UPI000701145F|nr:hypothetical protein [Paenibacillus sp. Soil750]KRE69885.1 hypothetical protein ASL11_16120 [Paenibacillus sp. Soil750]